MKKSVIKVSLLALTLGLVSMIVILSAKRTYTTSFEIRKGSYHLTLDNEMGIAEILEEKVQNGKYIVKIRGKQAGRFLLGMNYGSVETQKLFYIHDNMIITEGNYFGYANGSEIIPLSITILFAYILFLFTKEYKKSVTENLYQYKNVAYLGIIIFLFNFIVINLFSFIHYQGIFDTINGIINSMTRLSVLFLPIAYITFILVAISNIKLVIKEEKSIKNLLGVFLGLFCCIIPMLPDYVYNILRTSQTINIYNLNSIGPYLYNFFFGYLFLILSKF